MSERVWVCREDEFKPGDREIVVVGTTQVGVVNVDGNYYAIENVCAHQYGQICQEAKISGRLEAEYKGPGERIDEFFSDEPVIACPEHGWEYDLTTGEHCGDSGVCLRTFEVIVSDGDVFVEEQPSG